MSLSPAPAAEPVAATDRDAWLYRRVSPGSHPLRELVNRWRCLPHGHAAQAAESAAPLPVRAPTTAPPAGAPLLLDDEGIARRIQDLPPLPQALSEAMRVVRDDELCADWCVRAIEQDAALAARVLRLANSPFYGACGKVASVGDAVLLLGLRTIAGVVIAVSMRGMLARWHRDERAFQAYWTHTVATAVAARSLAAAAGADRDAAFLAGLLHDLGRLLMAVFLPDPVREALDRAAREDMDPLDAEARHVGRTHDEIGAAVARHWKLPEQIVAAIARHHAPAACEASDTVPLEMIVHVANAIAHALDLVGDPAEAVPSVQAQAWRRVGLPEAEMPGLFEQVEAGVTLLAA